MDRLKMQSIADISAENNEDNMGRAISELIGKVNNSNIDIKTELSDQQIKDLVRIKFIADRLQSKTLIGMYITFLRLQLSKNRKSRTEIIDLLKAENSKEERKGLAEQIRSGLGL
jgi:hypothetical protein